MGVLGSVNVASGDTSFRRSLIMQLRVLWALGLREALTRFGRHNVGFLWLFFEPMSFTLGIVVLWGLLKFNHGNHIPIASFALTGYSSIMLWRNPASRISHSITVNMALLYHRNVRPLDIVLARVFLEFASITASFFTLTGVFVFFELCDPPVDIPLLVAGWLMMAMFALGLSLIVGALTERTEIFDRVWHTLTYLLFPFSGAGTLLDWLPPGARRALLYLPFSHGIEMIRHGFYGSTIRTYEDPEYLAVVSLTMIAFGIAFIRDTAKHLEPD
jgi:capsular polysaccharide transport system permease protein